MNDTRTEHKTFGRWVARYDYLAFDASKGWCDDHVVLRVEAGTDDTVSEGVVGSINITMLDGKSSAERDATNGGLVYIFTYS